MGSLILDFTSFHLTIIVLIVRHDIYNNLCDSLTGAPHHVALGFQIGAPGAGRPSLGLAKMAEWDS